MWAGECYKEVWVGEFLQEVWVGEFKQKVWVGEFKLEVWLGEFIQEVWVGEFKQEVWEEEFEQEQNMRIVQRGIIRNLETIPFHCFHFHLIPSIPYSAIVKTIFVRTPFFLICMHLENQPLKQKEALF